MTAAIGHPTLRLIRVQIGDWTLDHLRPGDSKLLEVESPEPAKKKPFKRETGGRRTTNSNSPARRNKDVRRPASGQPPAKPGRNR